MDGFKSYKDPFAPFTRTSETFGLTYPLSCKRDFTVGSTPMTEHYVVDNTCKQILSVTVCITDCAPAVVLIGDIWPDSMVSVPTTR